ncbi:hypothetical protein DPMN_056765 [Dreissena polymorpha]|uniref:Uncharacterized protein n=1 Tax=Dreissena polymorpha TaxID=45954 RepID=A0A9D4CU22_DREPO|nr:hypothetical protein DPMN_056765 [Dreissena polymorpha]
MKSNVFTADVVLFKPTIRSDGDDDYDECDCSGNSGGEGEKKKRKKKKKMMIEVVVVMMIMMMMRRRRRRKRRRRTVIMMTTHLILYLDLHDDSSTYAKAGRFT